MTAIFILLVAVFIYALWRLRAKWQGWGSVVESDYLDTPRITRKRKREHNRRAQSALRHYLGR